MNEQELKLKNEIINDLEWARGYILNDVIYSVYPEYEGEQQENIIKDLFDLSEHIGALKLQTNNF